MHFSEEPDGKRIKIQSINWVAKEDNLNSIITNHKLQECNWSEVKSKQITKTIKPKLRLEQQKKQINIGKKIRPNLSVIAGFDIEEPLLLDWQTSNWVGTCRRIRMPANENQLHEQDERE